MRVISGKARGCKLFAPPGTTTRPTADRVKEAVFSMLTGMIPGAVFLDLFSGSGAIGIEALSRGAARAFFVDHDANGIKTIYRNLEKARLGTDAAVVKADYQDALASFGKKGLLFDIIYIDAPYYGEFVDKAVSMIQAYDILAEDGIIVAETAHDQQVNISAKELEIFKIKSYNIANIVFVRRMAIG